MCTQSLLEFTPQFLLSPSGKQQMVPILLAQGAEVQVGAILCTVLRGILAVHDGNLAVEKRSGATACSFWCTLPLLAAILYLLPPQKRTTDLKPLGIK
jgi:hypothetical protein